MRETLGSISGSTKAKQSRKFNKTWLNDPLYLAPQEKGVWPGHQGWVRFKVENEHSNSVLVVFPCLLPQGPVSPSEGYTFRLKLVYLPGVGWGVSCSGLDLVRQPTLRRGCGALSIKGKNTLLEWQNGVHIWISVFSRFSELLPNYFIKKKKKGQIA